MFEDFDFSVLDDVSFKEDSVREEIIAPILKRIGYKATGDLKVVRSKSLVHPFVMIGSISRKISVIPDYTLFYEQRPILVLDAKSPNESIINSEHVEQVYSYAIHPEIRVENYALCNGRELIVYAVSKWQPLLRIDIKDIDSNWNEVIKALHPRFLEIPELRDFFPDYGIAAKKAGIKRDILNIFPEYYLAYLSRVTDNLYTGSSTLEFNEKEYIVSFDLSNEMYEKLIEKLPNELADQIRNMLSRQPYYVDLQGKVVITCAGYLKDLTQGEFEHFVPVEIVDIASARYDPTVVLKPPSPKGV